MPAVTSTGFGCAGVQCVARVCAHVLQLTDCQSVAAVRYIPCTGTALSACVTLFLHFVGSCAHVRAAWRRRWW